jgi:DNA-binding IclR family transcriptional regulator
MTGIYRSPEFRPLLDDALAEHAPHILDALAEKLQQSCQLAVRVEEGFCIALQSTPSGPCFVNMPLGLVYSAPEAISAFAEDKTAQHPNPALPDVMDICAPVFRGGDQIALLIAPYIASRNAKSPEFYRHALQAAAQNLSQSFIMKTLVA